MSNTGKKESGRETPCSGNSFVKSSAYAPVSLNLMGMYLVKEHMNAHYKRIYNVKAAIDTKPPHSMQRSRSRMSGASRANSRNNSRFSSRINLSNSRTSLNQNYSKLYQESPDETKGNVQLMDKIDRYLESVQISNDDELKTYPSKVYNKSASSNQRINKKRQNRQSPNLGKKPKQIQEKQQNVVVSNEQTTQLSDPSTQFRETSVPQHPIITPSWKNDIQQSESPPLHKQIPTINSSSERRVVPALKIQRDADYTHWLSNQERKIKAEKELDELDLTLATDRSDDSLMEYEIRRYYQKNEDNDNYKNSKKDSAHSREVTNIRPHIHSPQSRRKLSSNRNLNISQNHLMSRSLVREQLDAEEEELKYLEFITEVTDEILLRGVYTDRALKHVFQYHMGKRNDLEFTKMRNLLHKLQDDLGVPRYDTNFEWNQEISNPKLTRLLPETRTSVRKETLNSFESKNRASNDRSNLSINLSDRSSELDEVVNEISNALRTQDINEHEIDSTEEKTEPDVNEYLNENDGLNFSLDEESGESVDKSSDSRESISDKSIENEENSGNSIKSESSEATDKEVESFMNYSNDDFCSSASEDG